MIVIATVATRLMTSDRFMSCFYPRCRRGRGRRSPSSASAPSLGSSASWLSARRPASSCSASSCSASSWVSSCSSRRRVVGLVVVVVLVVLVRAVGLVLVVLVPARASRVDRVGDPPGDGRAQHGDARPGSGLEGDPVGLDVEDGPEDARPGEDLVTGRELHERVALAAGRLGPGTDEEHVRHAEDDHQEQQRERRARRCWWSFELDVRQDGQGGVEAERGQWNGGLRL